MLQALNLCWAAKNKTGNGRTPMLRSFHSCEPHPRSFNIVIICAMWAWTALNLRRRWTWPLLDPNHVVFPGNKITFSRPHYYLSYLDVFRVLSSIAIYVTLAKRSSHRSFFSSSQLARQGSLACISNDSFGIASLSRSWVVRKWRKQTKQTLCIYLTICHPSQMYPGLYRGSYCSNRLTSQSSSKIAFRAITQLSHDLLKIDDCRMVYGEWRCPDGAQQGGGPQSCLWVFQTTLNISYHII